AGYMGLRQLSHVDTTSIVSNCIGWMDMYWYGDNLMNPWAQHVNRELLNLRVEPLWW
ncbi:hypothetical protein AVEN_259128-1, partial [Araneus ventricosus]